MRFNNLSPLVGDWVIFNEKNQLLSIKNRSNFLIRPKVANIDLFLILISLKEPNFSSILLDRFLMMVESQAIDVCIVFTKADLDKKAEAYFLYKSQGYKCFLISNKDKKQNFDKLSNELKNKLVVLSGQSGVGKTSLLNNLLGLENKTQEISKALNRGKHTTRVSEIFEINEYRLIDTPGFSSLEMLIPLEKVANAFQDFRFYSQNCKFRNCFHENETECGIKNAVQEKKISKKRYKNYLKILSEIKELNFKKKY